MTRKELQTFFFFLPQTLIWSHLCSSGKKVLINWLALMAFVDITLLTKTPRVQKLFEEPLFSSLWSPKSQGWLWNCCCACTDAGGLPLMEAFRCLWLDSRGKMATDSMWLVKQSQIVCSRSPSPTKIELSVEKVGFLSLSCYV